MQQARARIGDLSPWAKLGLGCSSLFLLLCCACLVVLAFPTSEPEPVAPVTVAPATPATDVPTAAPALPTLAPTAEVPASPPATTSAELPAGAEAIVTNVVDGDTIDVLIDGREYRVRYIGVDTPERGELFYDEATEANADLVAGNTVILIQDVSETDRYDRLLRYVYLPDGTFVNAELVRRGFAQVSTFPPDVAHEQDFLALQREARASGRGLWSDVGAAATATPPPAPSASSRPRLATITPAIPKVPPPPLRTALPPNPGDVVISDIFFDGAVPRVESDEYVVITNQGGASVNLTDWRLNAGDSGQNFVFPDINLRPGDSCRVYTDEVHEEYCGLSFASAQAVWANDGQCGTLYNNAGVEVSRYCY